MFPLALTKDTREIPQNVGRWGVHVNNFSPTFREALEVTGHPPTVDLLVLGRQLMNPDNGFRKFWDQFREMDFGRGERGKRGREWP